MRIVTMNFGCPNIFFPGVAVVVAVIDVHHDDFDADSGWR